MNRLHVLFLTVPTIFSLAACTSDQDTMITEQPVQATVADAPISVTEETITEAMGITLPAGFTATLFAQSLPTPRHIVVNENGDVYTTLRSGQAKFRATADEGGVAALRDTNANGVADVTRVFGTSDIDTGLAIHDGNLYFSSMTTIYTVPLDGELIPASDIEVVVEQIPESAEGHRGKALTFDNDGNLYTQVGSPSNSCQAGDGPGVAGILPCPQLDDHGGVFRYSAIARNQVHAEVAERISSGHRNFVALEWNTSGDDLFVLMHGRDGMNQLWPESFSAAADIEVPAEEFHRLEEGDNFGWPYTYWDPNRNERMIMPEYGGDGETPATLGLYKVPLIAFPAHWSPNDIVFYENEQFPEQYRHGAFIAFHGAVVPRRADPGGYNVVFVPMDAAGEITGDWEIFADDFERPARGADAVGRPSGLAIGPDGSLYIGDDTGGRIWKISYTGE
jgi:glucose/arabinose dehydrogenase